MTEIPSTDYKQMFLQSNVILKKLSQQYKAEKDHFIKQFEDFRNLSQQRLINVSTVYANSLLRVLHGSSEIKQTQMIPYAEAQLLIQSEKQKNRIDIQSIQDHYFKQMQDFQQQNILKNSSGDIELTNFEPQVFHQPQTNSTPQKTLTEILQDFNKDSISNDIKLAPALPIILSLETSLKILQERHSQLQIFIQNDDTEIRLKTKYQKVIDEKVAYYDAQIHTLQDEFYRNQQTHESEIKIMQRQLSDKQAQQQEILEKYELEKSLSADLKDEVFRSDHVNKRLERSLMSLRSEITREITGMQLVDQHKSVGELQAQIIYLKGFEQVYIQNEQGNQKRVLDLEKTLDSTRRKNQILHDEVTALTKDAEAKVVGRFQDIIDQQLFQINELNQQLSLESQKSIDLQHDIKEQSHDINTYISRIRDQEVFVNTMRTELQNSINDYQNAQRQVDFLVRRSSILVQDKQQLKTNINELIQKNKDLVEYLNAKQMYYETQEINLRKQLTEKLGSIYGLKAETKAQIMAQEIFDQSKPEEFSETIQKQVSKENIKFLTNLSTYDTDLNEFEKGIEQKILVLNEIVECNIKAIQTEVSSTQEKSCYVYPAQLNDMKEFQQQAYFSSDDNIVITQYVEQLNLLNLQLDAYKRKETNAKSFRQDMYQELYKQQIEMVDSNNNTLLMMQQDIYSQQMRYQAYYNKMSYHKCKQFHEFVDEILYIQNQKDTQYLNMMNKMKIQQELDDVELKNTHKQLQDTHQALLVNYDKLKSNILFIKPIATIESQKQLDQIILKTRNKIQLLENQLALVSEVVLNKLNIDQVNQTTQIDMVQLDMETQAEQLSLSNQGSNTDRIKQVESFIQTDDIIVIQPQEIIPVVEKIIESHTEQSSIQQVPEDPQSIQQPQITLPTIEQKENMPFQYEIESQNTPKVQVVDFSCQMEAEMEQLLPKSTQNQSLNCQSTLSKTAMINRSVNNLSPFISENEFSLQQEEKYPLAMKIDFEVQVETAQPQQQPQQQQLTPEMQQLLKTLPKSIQSISSETQTLTTETTEFQCQSEDFSIINKKRKSLALDTLTTLQTTIRTTATSPTYSERNGQIDFISAFETIESAKEMQRKPSKNVKIQTYPLENLALEDMISRLFRAQSHIEAQNATFLSSKLQMETAATQIFEAKTKETAAITECESLRTKTSDLETALKTATTQAQQFETWYNKSLSENSKLLKEKPLTNAKAAKALAVLKSKKDEREEFEMKQLMQLGMRLADDFDKGVDKETQIEVKVSRNSQIDVAIDGECGVQGYVGRARSKRASQIE